MTLTSNYEINRHEESVIDNVTRAVDTRIVTSHLLMKHTSIPVKFLQLHTHTHTQIRTNGR